MRQYETEQDEIASRQTKLSNQPVSLSKYGEVKKGFDFLTTTPGKMRRGVARSGDALRGFTDFNMKVFRGDDRRWALYLEWVDLDGEGHRAVFPHEVVAGMLQRANSIIAQCRSERAQHAALTRKQKKERSKAEQS